MMFTELWDKDVLERSMDKSKNREYDGFDHIRENMDTAYQIGKTVLKGVKDAAELTNDYQDAKESVNKATSRAARTSSDAGLVIKKGKQPRIEKISQTTPVGHSNLSLVQNGIGASGTQVVGNNTAPPIQLKLGKQLFFNNSIENFLSLFNGTGTVSVAFGGRLQCGQDQRVRTYNVYRHSLASTGANTTQSPYPVGANIMNPGGDVHAQLQGAYIANDRDWETL